MRRDGQLDAIVMYSPAIDLYLWYQNNKMKYVFFLIFIALMFANCNYSGNKKADKEHIEGETEQEISEDQAKTLPEDTVIVDSNMSFDEAIKGTTAPQEVIDQLELINVEYYSTDGKLHRGQFILNKSVKKDIIEIFEFIKEIRFPVHQAVPIVAYDWDDDASMKDNNSSSFCYRKVAGTGVLSRHALGKAIDINPYFNPLIWKPPYEDRPVMPEGAVYDIKKEGTFYHDHPVVKEFRKRKFTWGYYFKNYYDNHHFHRD